MASISDANPKLHQSIIDLGEDEKNKLCYFMGVKRLFPLDLKQSCSSGDCAKRIKDLVDFETDVIFLSKFIQDHIVEVDNKENLCLVMHNTSVWNKRMLDFFHEQLKSICERSQDSGIPSTLEKSPKLENAYKQITQHLINTQILDANAFNYAILDVYDYDIIREIEIGKDLYLDTKAAKVDALPLVEEILEIEKNHKAAKKSAKKNKTTLDPSVSKDYIVQQIQLLENMPVDALQAEVEELTDQICPVAKHTMMFMEARKYISDTCVALNQAKKHSSNGLDETLDLLINKADSFKNEWGKKYAHAFTFFDRSNPKRQRIA